MSASTYHTLTGYDRFRMTPHDLDWANQPRLDKAYPPLDSFELDRHPQTPQIDYGELVYDAVNRADYPVRPLNIKTVSSFFYLAQTITAQSMHGGKPFYYRSVASAGALYPFELYLAAHRIEGLKPGVYHYDALNFSLTTLRGGPVPVIPPSSAGVAATVFLSGIFFRSAWKYRQRAYRYVLLDAGHLLENVRLALASLKLPFAVNLDFDDAAAEVALGLDPEREGCLACIHIMDGQPQANGAPAPTVLEPMPSDIVGASRVAIEETFYEPIETIHRAGCRLIDEAGGHMGDDFGIGRLPETWQPLGADPGIKTPDYLTVLRQRRSRRNFIPGGLDDMHWRGLLGMISTAAKGGISPWMRPSIGILAGDNLPVPAGFYLLDPLRQRWGQLASGRFLEPMAMACLDQMWLKNAAFHLLFISDPRALDLRWGSRAYRHVMIEAGRLGQQTYLAATAIGLGACGIGALYDREAADILELSDDGALLYLVGVGPVQRF